MTTLADLLIVTLHYCFTLVRLGQGIESLLLYPCFRIRRF